MIDFLLAQFAFRARAATVIVCTTGSATLAATTAGYTRTAGSFVADGFLVGMEITPTGFTQTAPGVVSAVTATLLTIDGGRTAQASGAGRTLTAGLPLLRAWENDQPFTRDVTRPFVEEDFVPGGSSVLTWPARIGILEQDGISTFKWYGIQGVGDDAISASVTALMRLFTPGTYLSLSDGSSIEISGDVAVKRSQIMNTDDGWAVCAVTIPWRAYTRNVVAA
jgi:hypothetical protein